MAFRLISHHKKKFSPLVEMARRMITINVTSPLEFEEKALKSDVPVIVDFHAEWCGPCKMMDPNLNKVVEKYEGKVNLVKVDVDELQDLAMEYGVMSIPYVIGLSKGEIVGQLVGLNPEEKIEELVVDLLKNE